MTALAAGGRAGALAALLEAWRKAKHPRIADVIDHVSCARPDTRLHEHDGRIHA